MKKDSDSLISSDTDTISVTDIDRVMLDDIDVTEAGTEAAINVTDNVTVDVTDDVFGIARITDTGTTDNDAVRRGIVSSALDIDSGPDLNVVNNAAATITDSANG